MSYKTVNEIIYKDEFNTSMRIAPGSVLTAQEEKALAKDIPHLVKTKAVVDVEAAEAKAAAKAKPEVKAEAAKK